jgi:hypothetical protein
VTHKSARPGSPTRRNGADMYCNGILLDRKWTPEKPSGSRMTEELTRFQQRQVPATLNENALKLPRPLDIVTIDTDFRIGITSPPGPNAVKRSLEVRAPEPPLPEACGPGLANAKWLSREAERERTWFAHAQWLQAAASVLLRYPQTACPQPHPHPHPHPRREPSQIDAIPKVWGRFVTAREGRGRVRGLPPTRAPASHPRP